ncbi:interleukin 7 [Rhinolophus ferrumequinum]|uniref:Interleukin-7 n=1 Tax=Rhinolophus ferrumequinum TaxID=59479 RepID=A0A671ED16_RHIFE|nr:interleukin-7 isoform X7 [Rhinolophus ferrumequinum]KAF6323318.1 interleukin 7 [Rhinolophus ferrumequinum]
MFHVSLRYIFGIPPLILVLLPVASPDCEIEGKNGEEYRHVLTVSFEILAPIGENDSNCLNNEHNFFKKHSCDDDKEATFLKTAARKLKHFLNTNIHEELKHHLSIVSQGTLKLLNCTRKEAKKSLKEQRKQDDMCFLRMLLQQIKTCWNKILRGTKEH